MVSKIDSIQNLIIPAFFYPASDDDQSGPTVTDGYGKLPRLFVESDEEPIGMTQDGT